MRMQLVPLPAINPFTPSSRHIFCSAFHIPTLYCDPPPGCTCSRIFNRSNGLTTVRDTAPATPPETKDATTGCDSQSRICQTGADCAALSMVSCSPPSRCDASGGFWGSALIISFFGVFVVAWVAQVRVEESWGGMCACRGSYQVLIVYVVDGWSYVSA